MHETEPDRWDPWSPVEVAGWLNHTRVAWAVAGGWALELFAGETWRSHEDLEIVIDRDTFETVRDALPPLEWFVAGDGKLCPLEHAGATIEQRWQTWGRDPDTRCWRIDLMRQHWPSGEWTYRREPAIRRSLAEAIATTQDSIPYLAPEIVLLFKAKHCRAKDEEDFTHVLPRLNDDQRGWLADTLKQEQPAHPWLPALRSTQTLSTPRYQSRFAHKTSNIKS